MNTKQILDNIHVVLKDRLCIVRRCESSENAKTNRSDILCDQILDSLIVGGITGLSAYVSAGEDATLKSALLAFVLTFLIKLKEYRKIK